MTPSDLGKKAEFEKILKTSSAHDEECARRGAGRDLGKGELKILGDQGLLGKLSVEYLFVGDESTDMSAVQICCGESGRLF